MFLGELVDPATNQRTGTKVELDSSSLTTHGVIVGQTGSGKTGLGIVAIEEALSEGIPCLVIDPKGDLGNLLLTFPGLSAEEFAPWVEGDDPAKVALQWTEGLASFGIDASRIAALRAKASFTIYTPGSDAGVGLNLIGSLRAPTGAADDPEGRLDEIGSIVSGLLSLMGIESDPLSGREHILLTNLLDKAWSTGTDMDLASLIAQIQTPPMRKLGVLELDTFYPPKDRLELALKMNGLAASPSFAAWGEGEDLDIDALLFNGDKPRCAIVSIAHLSDEERQFAIAVLLGRLITWMRKQPGTSKLRAMVYFDEVFGFVPPTAMPPTKKPILTLLKQARAFGIGMVLATQNPVDVDYKALANATTWMVGRLQTERDKARLLDGMRSAAGGVDIDALGATISGLAKRSFVLHRSGQPTPSVFTTRWTMAYLRGPLTREQIRTLMGSSAASVTAATAAPPASAPALADNEVPVPPPVAKGTSAYFLHPAAPWADQVGASTTSKRYEPYLAARVNLLFDDDDAGVREADEWEAVFPLAASFSPDNAIVVDYDPRDFLSEAPTGATFVLPKVSIGETALFSGVSKVITDYLLVNKTMELQHNEALKLWSRTGETADDFLARCDVASQAKADVEATKLRSTLETRIDRVQAAMDEAERKKELAKHEAKSSRATELLTGAGDLLGALLGGRRNARSIARSVGSAVNRHGRASDKAAKADTAEDRLSSKVDELTSLESQLHDELFAIDAKWDEVGRAITAVQIPLEKTDIRVVELAVVWVPK
jgi:hypothetical protein